MCDCITSIAHQSPLGLRTFSVLLGLTFAVIALLDISLARFHYNIAVLMRVSPLKREILARGVPLECTTVSMTNVTNAPSCEALCGAAATLSLWRHQLRQHIRVMYPVGGFAAVIYDLARGGGSKKTRARRTQATSQTRTCLSITQSSDRTDFFATAFSLGCFFCAVALLWTSYPALKHLASKHGTPFFGVAISLAIGGSVLGTVSVVLLGGVLLGVHLRARRIDPALRRV